MSQWIISFTLLCFSNFVLLLICILTFVVSGLAVVAAFVILSRFLINWNSIILCQFFAEYNSKLLESSNYITRRQAVKV